LGYTGCWVGVGFCVASQATLDFNDDKAFASVFEAYGGMSAGGTAAYDCYIAGDDVVGVEG
jgi:hypothetical protein